MTNARNIFVWWQQYKNRCNLKLAICVVAYYKLPHVVTGEKNNPTVAHACRKRRLKWLLPQVGVGAQG
jgi:hypothetical protein